MDDPRDPTEHLKAMHRQIAKIGWSVMAISGEEGGNPPLSYTIGLFETFNHPEIVVFGLGADNAKALLNACGEAIRDGQKFINVSRTGQFLEGFDVEFRHVVDDANIEKFVGNARWYYGDRPFKLLQLTWPDKDGAFPGEPDAAEYVSLAQPLLS